MTRWLVLPLLAALAPLLLHGCGQDEKGPQTGIVQTGFPGQLSAGGSTSGAVMAQSSGGKTGSNMPAGTPGIPKGSEGNVGGAQSATAGAAAASQGAQQGQASTPKPSSPGASAMPPVREGRGSTAPDAATATSPVPRGNVADAPPPSDQARKEKSK